MAHEIDQTVSRQGSAMFSYQPAWHGLGTVVSAAQRSEDALRIAGLDWDVALTELQARFADGAVRDVPTHRATFRTDTMTPLGAVGTRYTPLQNRDAFAWMDDVVGESLAIWHTCGSLRGGRTVWMLCKLPEVVEVTDTDLMDQYVLVTNHHDGFGSVRLFPTTVRVVCANTLRLATSRGLDVGLKLRHTAGSLANRVNAAKECLGVIRNAQGDFLTDARRMQVAQLATADVQGYFDALAANRPSTKARERLTAGLWERFHLPTNEGGYGSTVWTAYNAASEFADHAMRVTGTGEQRMERRFSSVLFGAAHEFKDRAWRTALELAC